MSRRIRLHQPLMKPYVVVGNYNNGIQFVLRQASSQTEAINIAYDAKKRDERRPGRRGARLKCFIFKLHTEI